MWCICMKGYYSYEEEWSYFIWRKMDGTKYHVNRNNLSWETETLPILSYVQNLKSKMSDSAIRVDEVV
jgi:hypothetical protein